MIHAHLFSAVQPVVCIVVRSVARISLILVYLWSGCEPSERTDKRGASLQISYVK